MTAAAAASRATGGDVAGRARAARVAARALAVTSAAARDAGIAAIAEQMLAERDSILAANAADLENGAALVAAGELEEPLLKRLDLGGGKFDATVEMVRSVLAQEDPLGATQSARELDEGLRLYRVTVPIGVLGVIFESRPDALVQIASLCLKSGNAVLLKGGREAAGTNAALARCIAGATCGAGLPEGWIALMETREDVSVLLGQEESIDLIVPRGSNEFVQHIMNNTNIPVMGHADGICHVYVDKGANLDKAVRITVDAKTQYVAVCKRRRHPACSRRHRRAVLRARAPGAGRQGGGDSRRRAHPGAGRGRGRGRPGHRGGLVYRVPRPGAVGESSRHGARSGRPRQRVRQPPHRRHRHRGRRGGQPVPAQRRLGLGPAQRLHPLRRRLPLRAWGPRSGSAPGGCTAAARSGWRG